MRRRAHSLLVALLIGGFGSAAPLAAPTHHVDVPTIAPRPEDVATIHGILREFYDVISGPAGQPRQWARFGDGARWWIAAAHWDDERPGNPIPKEYLP